MHDDLIFCVRVIIPCVYHLETTILEGLGLRSNVAGYERMYSQNWQRSFCTTAAVNMADEARAGTTAATPHGEVRSHKIAPGQRPLLGDRVRRRDGQ